jgi:hypothetical protein
MLKGSSKEQAGSKKPSPAGSQYSSPSGSRQSSPRQSASPPRQTALPTQPPRTSSATEIPSQGAPIRFSTTHGVSVLSIRVSTLGDNGQSASAPSQRNCSFAIRDSRTDKSTIYSLHGSPGGCLMFYSQDNLPYPCTISHCFNMIEVAICHRMRLGELDALLRGNTSDVSSLSWVRACLKGMFEVGLISKNLRKQALASLSSSLGLDLKR